MWAIPRRGVFLYKGISKDIVSLLFKNELINGKNISKFEKEFASYIGVDSAVSISSGTAALSLILESLPLNKGDEVILSSYTFYSIPACIIALGLKPHFVDIDPLTDNIDIPRLKAEINSKTKAIILTHLFGIPCNINEIQKFIAEKTIFLIEDCAHAIGSEYNERKVGSFGDVAFFSFSLTKPFNTFNGGMIVSNNTLLIDKIRKRIQYLPTIPKTLLWKNILVAYMLNLLTRPLIFTFLIYPSLLLLNFINRDIINFYNKTFKKIVFSGNKKFKFSNVQALVGIKILRSYDVFMSKRLDKIRLFNELCREANIKLFSPKDNNKIFHYFFVIKHSKKDMLAKHLLIKGIDTGKYLMSNCSKLFNSHCHCHNTEMAYYNSLQLPIEYCNREKMQALIHVFNKYGHIE